MNPSIIADMQPWSREQIMRILLVGGVTVGSMAGGALAVDQIGVANEIAYVAGFLTYVALDGIARGILGGGEG